MLNLKLILGFVLILGGGFAGHAQAQTVIKPQNLEPGKFCHVIFQGQTNLYSVRITWAQEHSAGKVAEPPADIRNMQVWLLQPDGTCVSQMSPPGCIYTGMLGLVDDEIVFTFNRNATNEVIGAVLRYRGKLYCNAIEPAKP